MEYTKGNLSDSSDFSAKGPSEDIICKNCRFQDDGTIYSQPYTKGSCQRYPFPKMKPIEILFKNSGCDYFQSK